MIIIADSGSTKTDWCLLSTEGKVASLQTEGINPVMQDDDTIKGILAEVVANFPQNVNLSDCHFYGSGVRPEMKERMAGLLFDALGVSSHAESDLLGAARALCGRSRGIACILGTGSNSCYFDGERIVENTPSLGYVLGDEGSGAVLGIRFINALFKKRLPETLRQEFENETGLLLTDIIQRVYRKPMPNRFLASLSHFIVHHLACEPLCQLVTDHFRTFFHHNIRPYGQAALPVNAVGSIAFHYCEQLKEAARLEGFVLGRIERSPMEGLVAYHRVCEETVDNNNPIVI